jgi:hypothetical protein
MQVVWNGTEMETRDLLVSIERHCACEYAANGARVGTCAPHHALIRSQRFLDGLLFARHMRLRFIAEEWRVGPKAHSHPAGLQTAGI